MCCSRSCRQLGPCNSSRKMFFTSCTVCDIPSSEVFLQIYIFTVPIFPFEITYLNGEAQWGGLLVKELHIEPQQPNFAKGEKSAAHETQAFDCWDSQKTHNQTRALKGQAHMLIHAHTHTQTHVHTDHAPRDLSHTDTVAVLPWHQNQAWYAIWSWEEGLLEGCWNRVVHASTVCLTIWLGILRISNFEQSCKREEEGRWMDGDRGVDSCRVKSSQSSVAPIWWMYSV